MQLLKYDILKAAGQREFSVNRDKVLLVSLKFLKPPHSVNALCRNFFDSSGFELETEEKLERRNCVTFSLLTLIIETQH